MSMYRIYLTPFIPGTFHLFHPFFHGKRAPVLQEKYLGSPQNTACHLDPCRTCAPRIRARSALRGDLKEIFKDQPEPPPSMQRGRAGSGSGGGADAAAGAASAARALARARHAASAEFPGTSWSAVTARLEGREGREARLDRRRQDLQVPPAVLLGGTLVGLVGVVSVE